MDAQEEDLVENGILGIDINYEIVGGSMLKVSVSGIAVIVDKY